MKRTIKKIAVRGAIVLAFGFAFIFLSPTLVQFSASFEKGYSASAQSTADPLQFTVPGANLIQDLGTDLSQINLDPNKQLQVHSVGARGRDAVVGGGGLIEFDFGIDTGSVSPPPPPTGTSVPGSGQGGVTNPGAVVIPIQPPPPDSPVQQPPPSPPSSPVQQPPPSPPSSPVQQPPPSPPDSPVQQPPPEDPVSIVEPPPSGGDSRVDTESGVSDSPASVGSGRASDVSEGTLSSGDRVYIDRSTPQSVRRSVSIEGGGQERVTYQPYISSNARVSLTPFENSIAVEIAGAPVLITRENRQEFRNISVETAASIFDSLALGTSELAQDGGLELNDELLAQRVAREIRPSIFERISFGVGSFFSNIGSAFTNFFRPELGSDSTNLAVSEGGIAPTSGEGTAILAFVRGEDGFLTLQITVSDEGDDGVGAEESPPSRTLVDSGSSYINWLCGPPGAFEFFELGKSAQDVAQAISDSSGLLGPDWWCSPSEFFSLPQAVGDVVVVSEQGRFIGVEDTNGDGVIDTADLEDPPTGLSAPGEFPLDDPAPSCGPASEQFTFEYFASASTYSEGSSLGAVAASLGEACRQAARAEYAKDVVNPCPGSCAATSVGGASCVANPPPMEVVCEYRTAIVPDGSQNNVTSLEQLRSLEQQAGGLGVHVAYAFANVNKSVSCGGDCGSGGSAGSGGGSSGGGGDGDPSGTPSSGGSSPTPGPDTNDPGGPSPAQPWGGDTDEEEEECPGGVCGVPDAEDPIPIPDIFDDPEPEPESATDSGEDSGGTTGGDFPDPDEPMPKGVCRAEKVLTNTISRSASNSVKTKDPGKISQVCASTQQTAKNSCENTLSAGLQSAGTQVNCNNWCKSQPSCEAGRLSNPSVDCTAGSCTYSQPRCKLGESNKDMTDASGEALKDPNGNPIKTPRCPIQFWNPPLGVYATASGQGSVLCTCY